MATTTQVQVRVIGIGAVLALALLSLGCSYALQVPTPSAKELIRVVAKSPEKYALHLQARSSTDYEVPPDGRVTIAEPAYSRGCTVRLFNLVKVSDGDNPLNRWTLKVTEDGKLVRTLTLHQMNKLRTDSEGYRLLEVDR